MRNTTTITIAAALAANVIIAGAATAELTPEQRCEAVKLRLAGEYAICRLAAESRAARTGVLADFTKCTGAFSLKWQSAETKATNAGGACITEGDEANIKSLVDGGTADVATALSGGGLPPVCGNGTVETGESCDVGNLNSATCVTQGFEGGTLACATGCTFDESACYATRFDASGATIIDHQTGLEWEKKDSAGGGWSLCPGGLTCANAHDVDNVYQWSSTGTAPDGGAFTDFLAKLNGGKSSGGPTTGCYAGHCDWRLPTLEELLGVPWPAVYEFQPDAGSYYWSASTYANHAAYAMTNLTLIEDEGYATEKTWQAVVRAVRSVTCPR